MNRRFRKKRSISPYFDIDIDMDEVNEQSYDYLLKLICIGESTVGKTTFLHQYIHDNFSNFRSTIGVDIFKKCINYKDNHRVLLQLWDTAGQERYRSLTNSLFRDSMGFLLLFDVTNESSFLTVRDWLTHIETFTHLDNELRPPIVLVGNKIDLVQHRTIDTIRAQQLANDLEITYIETSAVTGTHVKDALMILVDQIFDFMERSMQKYYQHNSMTLRLTLNNHDETSLKLSKKSSCLCK